MNELHIELVDQGHVTKYIRYQNFMIGNRASYYDLHMLTGYNEGDGNPSDPMKFYIGMKFGTEDKHELECEDYVEKWGWWGPGCGPDSLTGNCIGLSTSTVTCSLAVTMKIRPSPSKES